MKKDENPPIWFVIWFIVVCVFGFIWIDSMDPIDKVKGVFGNRSDAKEYCSNRHSVLNAKTNYAAKKAYKACMSNY